jgi:phospholipid/cholesterol/gamma-HCH transport system substrate-binding protein
VFFVVGVALVGTIVFVIAQQVFLNPTVTYFIRFQGASVGGLEIGSPVSYNGIEVGGVRDISFAEDSVEQVVVTIAVDREVPIKEDAEAQLQPIGITGRQQIALLGATDDAGRLDAGAFIDARQSAVEQVTEPALSIVQRLDELVNSATELLDQQNRDSVSSFLATARDILQDNEEELQSIIANIDTLVDQSSSPIRRSTEDIQSATQDIAVLARQLRELSDAIDQSNMEERIPSMLENIDQTVQETQQSISYIADVVRENESDLTASIETLQETVDYLNNFALQISENPSRLIR